MHDQLVDLVVGGLAIIASHPHLHIIRDDGAAQFVEPFQHLVGHGHGVGALFLGHGNMHGLVLDAKIGALLRRAEAQPGITVGFGNAVRDRGDIAQVHRLLVDHGDHQPAKLLGVAQKLAAAYQNLFIALLKTADGSCTLAACNAR